MHQRKAKMADLSDAFILLPGGIGSLDEFFEMMTWTQLGYQQKPLAILNIKGYYNPLIQFLDKSVEEGFLDKSHRSMLLIKLNAKDMIIEILGHNPTCISRYDIKS